MNRDQAKGTIDATIGSAKRKAGEVTGNTKLQAEGILQQVKGSLETAWGDAKEAVREANKEADVQHKTRVEAAIESSAVETEPRSTKP